MSSRSQKGLKQAVQDAHDVSGVGAPFDLLVSDPNQVHWPLGGGLSIDVYKSLHYH